MRRMRGAAGVSLRDLETHGLWRRSTLSQVENGKARPSRQLVQWYDDQIGSDGLLLSIYAEARTRQLLDRDALPGQCVDHVQIIDIDPPAGHLVNRGALLQAVATVRNVGPAPWRDRKLHRMGAFSGLRLVGSAPQTRVPDTAPGDTVEVVLELRAPELPGSVVAYWQLVDEEGRPSADSSPPLAVLLVVA